MRRTVVVGLIMSRVQDSKLLSLVLRHQPEVIGVELDPSGWVSVDDLLVGLKKKDSSWTLERLRAVVAENDKRRFAFDAEGKRIRASQGHSVEVALGYEALQPPDVLYHGTIAGFLPSIRQQGLVKGARHHVHLSATVEAARQVGARRGEAIVLAVRAGEMHRQGSQFFCSENGVWLVEHVPTERIENLEGIE